MMRCTFGLVVAGLVLGWAGRTNAANLVANGDFETGGYDYWNLGGTTVYDYVESFDVHSGTYAAQFSGFGADTTLSQDLPTCIGAKYPVSYWLESDGGTPNDITVTFGGQTLYSAVDVAAFSWTQFSFTVVATATTSTLEFAARDDPGYFYLDNVSVMAPVPGDANNDGKVDINDLTIVLTNFGRSGLTWPQGDFNSDGRVDVNDLTIVLSNFGATASASINAVPEPAGLVLLGVGTCALLCRAHRRR